MSAIGKAIEGLGKDIGHAVEGVANGIGNVVKGGIDLAKGALTLNPKEMLSGAKEAAGGAFGAVKSAADLTPEGLEASAANNLLDGVVSSFGGSGSGSGSSTLS
ncbi:hypothetical protein PQQ52_25770 [Paraburkholderia sediminicola]|uniref:hypothetical protein n=1 Tax=Paraburkholderia sediminicola TaxID=458836 RepID=UPI0038BB4F9C